MTPIKAIAGRPVASVEPEAARVDRVAVARDRLVEPEREETREARAEAVEAAGAPEDQEEDLVSSASQ